MYMVLSNCLMILDFQKILLYHHMFKKEYFLCIHNFVNEFYVSLLEKLANISMDITNRLEIMTLDDKYYRN